jgi:hypothetical protein
MKFVFALVCWNEAVAPVPNREAEFMLITIEFWFPLKVIMLPPER